MGEKTRLCRDCGCKLTRDNCYLSHWNGGRNICKICHLAYCRSRRESWAARRREYYLAHQEERAAYDKKYNRIHREERLAYSRQRYQIHREEYAIHNGEYYRTHREGRAQIARRYRARKQGAEGTHTLTEWKALCEAANRRCLACGRRLSLTVDHIVPLSKGGSNRIDNIQPLCISCNTAKGVKSTNYWLSHRRVIPVGHQNCRSEELGLRA